MLDVVPGLELLRGELVWLGHRERVHFLDHWVPNMGCSDRPVGGNLGVEDYLHLGGYLPDSRAQDKEVQNPVLPFFRDT
eukprot:10738415-Heterocapsa_arctica.AAC.1